MHRIRGGEKDTPVETVVLKDFDDKGIRKDTILPLRKHIGVNVDGQPKGVHRQMGGTGNIAKDKWPTHWLNSIPQPFRGN